MSERARAWIVWGLAAVLFTAGVALAVDAVSSVSAANARLERKASELEALRRLNASVAEAEALRAALEALPRQSPPALQSLLDAALGPGHAAEVRELSDNRVDGWAVRRAEVVLENVPLEAAGRVAIALASPAEARVQGPLWRLMQATVQAAPGSPGRGRVAFTLEALDKGSAR